MKENKIEKLILNLSNRWECTPQEAVDRLNSMNESEINKLINSMTKKFQMGGRAFGPKIPYGNYMIIGTKTEVLPKKSEVTQAQIDSAYNAEQDAFRKRAEQLIPELEQRNAETKQRLGNNQNWQTIKANSPVQMPVTNSDPQYFNGPRNFKFENGGFIDCLRNGDSVEKCKCGCDKIAKAEYGKKVQGGNALYPYHKGKFVQSVDSNPLYPAGDGEGQISGEIRPLGDTVTVYRTPSHIYTQTRTTDGDVFIDHSAPNGSRRYYSPESKSRGFMRNVAPSWMVDLMNGVKEKFSTDVQTKKCGGSLPKKKKNYLKKK